MSFLTRASAALAFLALLHTCPVRAELVPMKNRRVFLASSAEEVVASGAKDLFRERILLKGGPGCIVVRFSGEVSGSDGDIDADDDVLASFDVAIEEAVSVAPIFQGVPASGEPRLVSLSGHACNLPPGAWDVSVAVRTENAGDEVTVGARTLEIWTEGGRLAPSVIGTGPAE